MAQQFFPTNMEWGLGGVLVEFSPPTSEAAGSNMLESW